MTTKKDVGSSVRANFKQEGMASTETDDIDVIVPMRNLLYHKSHLRGATDVEIERATKNWLRPWSR